MRYRGRRHVAAIPEFVGVVQRWRYPLLAILLVLTGLAGWGLRYLTFDADYQSYFSDANPQLTAYRDFQNTYLASDNILFALEPAQGDVFTREALGAVDRLTRAAWQIAGSRRVDSLTNFQYSSATADGLSIRDLVPDPTTLTDHELTILKAYALSEPLLVRRLVSPSGRMTGVNVTLALPENANDTVTAAITQARRLANRIRRDFPGLRLYLTGGLVMDQAFPEASLHDIRHLVPVVFVVMVLTMALFLRSLTGTFITVLVMVLSAVTGVGLAGWLGIRITPPSVGAATIIMTLAVADSVHLLTTLFWEEQQGLDRREALTESLRLHMQPVFLTSLTTAIGFLSMNFSDAPPFRDLGNITAMGVAAAFLYSLLLLPALTLILPARARPMATERSWNIQRFAEFVIRRRRPLLWGTTTLAVLLAAFIPRIELNDQFVEYFDESVPFRVDTEHVMRNLTGIYQFEYSIPAGESYGIGDPDYLRHLDALVDWFNRQPETVHVNAITYIMKRLNMNLHGDDPAWYRLPRNRELAAQYLLLYEMSLPYGLDLNDQINVDKSASRLTATVGNLSTREFRDLEARAQRWMRDHLPATMVSRATGPAVMFAYISERNIRTMLAGSALALFLITVTLVVSLGSVRLGLLSIIPNLLPALMAFGFWGLVVGQVGLVVSVVFAMALGIVVDDTVHFMHNFLRGREMGRSPEDAVRFAFASVGRAMWITSAVLITGFLLLTLSTFKLNSTTGLLTGVTIGFALLADFLLLPPLLLWVGRGRFGHRGPAGTSGEGLPTA